MFNDEGLGAAMAQSALEDKARKSVGRQDELEKRVARLEQFLAGYIKNVMGIKPMSREEGEAFLRDLGG